MLSFVPKASIRYRNVDLLVNSARYITTVPSPESTDEKALTVSYLIDSCGLSMDRAISVSKQLTIKNTEKPNLVLKLLENHGFTKSDIAHLISNFPKYLAACPEKTLKPKIEFFESLGIVGENLSKILCRNRHVLHCSLENHILPLVNFLKEQLDSDEDVVYAFRNSPWKIAIQSIDRQILPNISTLRAQGVPQDLIRKLLVWYPRALMLSVDLFKTKVEDVKAMGFPPTRTNFILAVHSMAIMRESTWERKKELIMSYGWSEEEFLSAFSLQPNFITTSEKKIVSVMDFLLNTVGLKPSDVARCPKLCISSLERRLIPRWFFLKALRSKGFIKDFDPVWALVSNTDDFEKIYVKKYEEKAPDIVKAFRDGSIVKLT